MQLTILDQEFNTVAVIDEYKSLVWTDRYYEWGDFELFTEVTADILQKIQEDYYILNKESEHGMIVDTVEIESDLETGSYIKITGYSFESILDRRIVWGLKTVKGDIQTCIQTLLNECIINPSNADRKIDNFKFQSTDDEYISGITIEAQYTGDGLYDIISSLCKAFDLGFKITLNDDNEFVFQLYSGVDRSYNQDKNPYVIFSPGYENIVNSNYYTSSANYKNVTLIGGEGEGTARRYATLGSGKGINRRELFTDARDLSSTDGNTQMSSSAYNAVLINRGQEKLDDHKKVTMFEGEVEARRMFVYKKDFYMGDVVQIANEFGSEGTSRITEFVIAENVEDGFTMYPTFTMLEDEDTTEEEGGS